jgi:hypothetical protein
VNFLERFLLKRIKISNQLDVNEDISELEKIVKEKRDEIYRYLNENGGNNKMEILSKDFTEYTMTLEQVILVRRLESGVSTLIYFIYTILGNIAGVIMSVLVYISTTGYIGHIILLISIAGGIAGIGIALFSMKKERKFISSLKNGI